MLSVAVVTVASVVSVSVAGAALPPACSIILNSPPVLSARTNRSRAEIRDSYRQVRRHANERNKPDPFEVTPELLLLFWEIDNPKSLPPTERGRMRRGLKGRLEVMSRKLARIRRDALRNSRRRRSPRTAVRNRTATARRSRATNPGGGVAARAAALIDLIQNTIAPDSWAVNGGRGSISFLGAPFYVLVIRNTGEVHHQIGGGLRARRR